MLYEVITTWITLPLKHKSSFTKICDLEIDNTQNWSNKLRKTLELNYGKAPMFNDVFPLMDNILNYPTKKLSDFNANSTIKICKYLNINTLIEHDSNKYKTLEHKLAGNNWPNADHDEVIKKTQRVFDIS